MNHLQSLIKNGIPCSKAVFHAAVNNSNGEPSNYFATKSDVASRRCKMWYTPHTLICLQNDKAGLPKYFGVPTSTVIFVNFEDETSEKDPEVKK